MSRDDATPPGRRTGAAAVAATSEAAAGARDWTLAYDTYEPDQVGQREALTTLGNGYFATRGAAPDVAAGGVHYPGTYLAGGYNRLVSEVAGREIENEDLVNLPNWLPLALRIDDGPWQRFDEATLLGFRHALDLKRGVLQRELCWRDAAGRITRWSEQRLVSMADPHLAALRVEVTAENWSGRLGVRTALDGSVTNGGVPRYAALASRHLEVVQRDVPQADVMRLVARTTQSGLRIALAARTRLLGPASPGGAPGAPLEDATRDTRLPPDQVVQELACAITHGDTVVVEKVVALHTSRDRACSEPALAALERCAGAGPFETLLAAHALAWKHLWQVCDIEMSDGEQATCELKVRFHVFQLLQTVSPHTIDLDVGVPARGWHGEAYRGHIFWDELFIFPYLTLRLPVLTRALLRYRYRRLDAARRAAREAGFAGAMFPWQSGSDGREESQRLHLNPASGRWIPDNTWRQRHISSAIAYNVWQYYQATDDREFLFQYGAEMMFEIARFWASAATYNAGIDRFEIKGVMGPDEFHTARAGTAPEAEGGVDNNAYTNVLAAWVLTRAFDLHDFMPDARRAQLAERIGLAAHEIERWREVATKLRVPFHGEGIISQFEGYGELQELDWEGYARRYGDTQRLDRLLEAEGDSPNRYQAGKQADVLMLFYLFSAEELALLFEQLGYPFGRDTIPKNIEYYLARTSHGSTLSSVAHAWVLARSNRPHSWNLFQRTLDADLGDVQGGTTREGIHVGAMAGSIDLVQRCFVGIEMRANALHFDPALPDDLGRVKVRLRYRRQVLDVEVDHERLCIRSGAATTAPITIAYRGHYRELAPGDRYEFRLLKPQARVRDENRPAGGAKPAP